MADDDSDDEGSGTPPLELAASYLAYCRRALRQHRALSIVASSIVLVLTIIAVIIWPRVYESATVLAAQENRVLDGDKTSSALTGAADAIRSRENVTTIVDELQLAKKWESTLSSVGRLKWKAMSALRGPMSEAAKREALIAMVQSSISVDGPAWNESKITISAQWQDGATAAALADAAEQSFLRSRHTAEISSITEYIGILDGHAADLRKEIEALATKSKPDDKKVEGAPSPAAPAAAPAPRIVMAAPPPKPAAPTEDLSELRAVLQEKQRMLQTLEDTRRSRVANAEASLAELRTKFTPAHPMVVSAESALASMRQDTPQMIQLRGEVAQLSGELKAKSAIKEETSARVVTRVIGGGGAAIPTPSTDALPAELMKLMQEGTEALNPSADAEFRTLISKYAMLRDKVTTARVDLDTAEAAFRRRYQIVIPPEVPSKPAKPKIPVILIGGLLASLGIGLLLAVIAELRTGKLVEAWQVDRLGLPRLAEVRWQAPPGGSRP